MRVVGYPWITHKTPSTLCDDWKYVANFKPTKDDVKVWRAPLVTPLPLIKFDFPKPPKKQKYVSYTNA